mgnify:CR=1 FL=1
MKLVGFEEFCRMPAGTVFAPYEPIILADRLAIKTDAGEDMPADYEWMRHDFLGVMPLEPWIDDKCDLWKIGDSRPASFEIYDGSAVDYVDYKMFLVFDEFDIDRMINALTWAKNGCEGPANCMEEQI